MAGGDAKVTIEVIVRHLDADNSEVLMNGEVVGITRTDPPQVKRPADDWLDLHPATKLEIIKAMGFSPHGDDHTSDCLAALDSGNRCNCVPDPVYYKAPQDVLIYTHETWEERLAAKRAKTAKDD